MGVLAVVFACSASLAALAASTKQPATKPDTAKQAATAKPVPKPAARPAETATVPVPKPAPKPAETAASGDAIGTIISDDFGETKAREDSDKPQSTGPVAAKPAVTAPTGALDSVGLRLAVKLIDNGDLAAATIAAYALPDKVDIKIVDWLVATSGSPDVPSSRILEVTRKVADWPGQNLLRIRYEQALAREKPAPEEVIRVLGAGKPVSDDGLLLLTRAYVASGRKADAAALIRAAWRERDFSASDEKDILGEFADLLTPSDHKARMDRMLYDEKAVDALRVASLLGKDQSDLAKAVVQVIKRQKTAGKAIDALGGALGRDPLVTYSRVQMLRRDEKFEDAAALLNSATRDPKALVDPDAWWIERRLISRALIEKGNASLAYKVAAGHSAQSATYRAEAEFHAGWYALEFLKDPATAKKHFAAIAAASTMPLSQSRAEYWLGRTSAAAGDKPDAAAHFKRAAAYPTTFYGQLAMARLGSDRIALSRPPAADAGARQRFEDRELVKVIEHLTAVRYADRAGLFYRYLGETLTDPAEIALLAGMAESSGEHQIALQIGKSAAVRGLPVETLAFPTSAIPTDAKTPSVEKSVVFAIARQESAFNPEAVSSAGAMGLLQLMPATAKQTAKSIGVAYSKSRLTSDPGYNATLGAAHLGELVGNFGGSYVMTFAAYNAGSSRVTEWVRLHGDPRDPGVDVVNWIEMIPFTETRNYVQRVMENLQVYRARLGEPALVIEADLKRGTRPAG
jgi:soluble lytic murein transglycosylase